MLKRLGGLTLRYRFLSPLPPGRLAESLREHQRIIEAFKQANHEEAARAQSANTLVRYHLDHEGMVSL